MQRVENKPADVTDYRPGWSFWLAWVLANSVGWIVGMSLAWLLSEFISPMVGRGWRIPLWTVGGMIVGVVFGINQWFLIRPAQEGTLGRRSNWWVLATILGWMISLLIVIGLDVVEQIGFALVGLVIGISVGSPQALVIHTNRSPGWIWVLAHAAAWTVGMSLLDLIDRAIGFSLAGVVSGAITGAALIFLIWRQLSEQ